MKTRIVAAALVAWTAVIAPAAHAAMPMMDESRGVLTVAPLLERITPGVVNISVRTKVAQEQSPLLQDPFFRRFFDMPGQHRPAQREAMAAGSGVIVDARKGYVLTNNHVIDNANSIMVTLKDHRRFKAKLVGTDPETDIALLKIDADKLTAVSLGDSSKIKVGDVVIAIGNPFGIGQTVTSGIVSALGRSGLGIEGYEDFIQTDASINPGNSGGALVDSQGRLIGINTAIIGPGGGNVGIGFAVPVDMVRSVMTQLALNGEVRRGRLGVMIQDLTPDIAQAMDIPDTKGAIVDKVEELSPASKAGIKAGDVIVALDGKAVKNSTDLRNRVGLAPVGKSVTLDLMRDGKKKSVSLSVEQASQQALNGDKTVPEFAGAVFRDIPNDHPLHGKKKGVLVANVERGSPAWQFGFRSDDVITAVNRKPVDSLKAFETAVKGAGKVIAMNVVRDGNEMFVVLQS